MKNVNVHLKTVKNDYITPREIPGNIPITFDLDPCLADDQPWRLASEGITKTEDGLATDWSGVVWCHPPHEDGISLWQSKNAEYQNSIAYYIANIHSKSFQKHVYGQASGMLSLAQRQSMYTSDGQLAPKGHTPIMVLVSYGKDCTEALREANHTGCFHALEKVKKTVYIPNKPLRQVIDKSLVTTTTPALTN